MHKKTTLKDFNVFVLKACLATLIMSLSFSVSFAQEQKVRSSQEILAEKQKHANAVSNSNSGASFGEAIKNESALKANTSSVTVPVATNPSSKAPVANTQNIAQRKAQAKAAGNTTASDVKTQTTERTAAEIERKKAGGNQNNAASAERFLKAKSN